MPVRPRRLSLGMTIALAVALKCLILFLLWRTFFSAPQAKHMRMPTVQVAQHLLDSSPPRKGAP